MSARWPKLSQDSVPQRGVVPPDLYTSIDHLHANQPDVFADFRHCAKG